MAFQRIFRILMAGQTRKELAKITSWKTFFAYAKIFLLYIGDVILGRYKSEHGARTILFLALIYLISPIDIIPDYILFWGQLDDIFVISRVLKKFRQDLVSYTDWKGIDLVGQVGYADHDDVITVTAEEIIDRDKIDN